MASALLQLASIPPTLGERGAGLTGNRGLQKGQAQRGGGGRSCLRTFLINVCVTSACVLSYSTTSRMSLALSFSSQLGLSRTSVASWIPRMDSGQSLRFGAVWTLLGGR